MLVILVPINVLIFRTLIPRYVNAAHGKKLAFGLRQIAYYIAGNYLALLVPDCVASTASCAGQ